MPGVTVRVLRLAYNGVTGERIAAAPSSGSVSATDDRGEYRAYGLPPGSYLVLVPGPTSGRSNTPMRRLTSEEVRQALQAARSSTSATPGAAVQLPPAIPGRFNLAPVFHPGVTDVSAASVVSVGTAQERSGIDIAIELVPTATISGTVSSNTGSLPALLSVRLVPVGAQTELLGGVATGVPSTQVQPDGRYSLAGVMPGSYQVKASVGWGRGVAPTGPTQWASADVFVSGEDLVVPLTLQPAVPITGRVLFEGAQPSASELESLSIALIAPGTGGAARATGGGRVDREGRFMMPNVIPDSYRFTTEWAAPGARDRWTIKSAVANGRETFESPLRVTAAEPLEWTLTFTDKPATLTGLLEGPGGRAATEYYILVFPADRAHWTPGSRRVGMTRPATDGTFTLKGLPPGDYLLAALLDLENGEWNDPTVLESLAPASVKVTLREGETTRQNYRMGGA
jgi:hypothetical protein